MLKSWSRALPTGSKNSLIIGASSYLSTVVGQLVRYISTSKSTTKKRTLQERVEQLAESLSPPLPLSKTEEDNLTGVLKGLLNRDIVKNSSDRRIESHFQSLLDGLQALTEIEPVSPSSVSSVTERKSLIWFSDKEKVIELSRITSSHDALAAFDELYYHGVLSQKVASVILKHKSISNVDDVNHLLKLAYGGGAGLYKWTAADKYTFRLQIANKFWSMGEKDQSRSLIVDCFELIWKPVLTKRLLSPYTVVGYGKALLVFKRKDLLLSLISSWSYETFSEQGDSPSEVLGSLFLPLWKAAISLGETGLSGEIIEAGLRCSNSQGAIRHNDQTGDLDIFDSVLLCSYVLDTLYHSKELQQLENPQMMADLLRSIEKVLPLPKADKASESLFVNQTVYSLMDLCSTLSLSSLTRPIALEMLPYFEAYTASVLKHHKNPSEARTAALLPVRLSLLQHNLSTQEHRYRHQGLHELDISPANTQ